MGEEDYLDMLRKPHLVAIVARKLHFAVAEYMTSRTRMEKIASVNMHNESVIAPGSTRVFANSALGTSDAAFGKVHWH